MASPTVGGTGARSRRLIERVRAMNCSSLSILAAGEDASAGPEPPPARRPPIPGVSLPVVATKKQGSGPALPDVPPDPCAATGRRHGYNPRHQKTPGGRTGRRPRRRAADDDNHATVRAAAGPTCGNADELADRVPARVDPVRRAVRRTLRSRS